MLAFTILRISRFKATVMDYGNAGRRGFAVHREYVDQATGDCAAASARPSSMP